jgi:hypothetical protein
MIGFPVHWMSAIYDWIPCFPGVSFNVSIISMHFLSIYHCSHLYFIQYQQYMIVNAFPFHISLYSLIFHWISAIYYWIPCFPCFPDILFNIINILMDLLSIQHCTHLYFIQYQQYMIGFPVSLIFHSMSSIYRWISISIRIIVVTYISFNIINIWLDILFSWCFIQCHQFIDGFPFNVYHCSHLIFHSIESIYD